MSNVNSDIVFSQLVTDRFSGHHWILSNVYCQQTKGELASVKSKVLGQWFHLASRPNVWWRWRPSQVAWKAFCRSGSSSAWIMKLLEDARYVHPTYMTSWMPGWHVDCAVTHLNSDATCFGNGHLLKFISFHLFNVVLDVATLTKMNRI